MGCRIFPLEIGVAIRNFEDDEEEKESVEFIRS
jgi:hypothetical protein